MIHVVIIDDEQHCINRLQTLLLPAYEKVLQIVATARTVEEGLKSIAIHKPLLVFHDVQICEKTGFDLLRALPNINFAIIFTTAYEKFAIQAIKFSAIDYLLKPIDEEDLNMAMLRFTDSTSEKTAVEKIDTLLINTRHKSMLPKKIIVPNSSGLEFLDIADIIRCESDINYTSIYIKDRNKLVVAKTLKEFEEMLSQHAFFRVHNSHLINLNYIKSYNKNKGGFVTLADGSVIEVSSRRKDDFLKKLAFI